MIDLYIGYGLFILYTFCVVMTSVILWLALGLAVGMYFGEDHTVDADWRPVAIAIFVVAGIAQWYLLKTADHVVRIMWHSLPPLPPLW